MIRSARQLKDKIKNMSEGNSDKAQTLLRNFIMERFLERISLSAYRDNFVIKGGMLVASLVGLNTRATMDIDTTVRSLTLSLDEMQHVMNEIAAISLEDGVSFTLKNAVEIMEEYEYTGIRFMLEARMDQLRQSIKIDMSTGDAITPGAIEYSYPLMFEERSIPLFTYNTETLLAEKLETVMTRGEANTRMRDFYDIHMIWKRMEQFVQMNDLHDALIATCQKRGTYNRIVDSMAVIDELKRSHIMESQWNNYCKNSFYVGNLSWEDVIDTTRLVMSNAINGQDIQPVNDEEVSMNMI